MIHVHLPPQPAIVSQPAITMIAQTTVALAPSCRRSPLGTGHAAVQPRFQPFITSCLLWNFKVKSTPEPFANYPQKLRATSTTEAPSYRLKSGYYAVHYAEPQDTAVGAELILEDGAIAIFKGEPEGAVLTAAQPVISPVYAVEPSGLAAVPTGKVFVRFQSGTKAETQRSAFEQAGFRVEEILDYAPEAAWLVPSSGKIEDGVKGFDALQNLPNVENIELQMLMERQRR